jgi:hypothetical protein
MTNEAEHFLELCHKGIQHHSTIPFNRAAGKVNIFESRWWSANGHSQPSWVSMYWFSLKETGCVSASCLKWPGSTYQSVECWTSCIPHSKESVTLLHGPTIDQFIISHPKIKSSACCAAHLSLQSTDYEQTGWTAQQLWHYFCKDRRLFIESMFAYFCIKIKSDTAWFGINSGLHLLRLLPLVCGSQLGQVKACSITVLESWDTFGSGDEELLSKDKQSY